MIIDCISDLHGHFPKLSGGDLLIIAGDCTTNDSMPAWQDFFNWIDKQEYRKKVMIAGNHDNFCTQWAIAGTFTNDEYDQMYPDERPTIDYLCDSGIEFEGVKLWGSPWTKSFFGIHPKCKAFTCQNDFELSKKWELIPDDTNIVITHMPPFGILDKVARSNEYVGSNSLRNHLMDRVKPSYSIFGHIHENGNKKLNTGITTFINASLMNEDYEFVNQPIRFTYEKVH